MFCTYSGIIILTRSRSYALYYVRGYICLKYYKALGMSTNMAVIVFVFCIGLVA